MTPNEYKEKHGPASKYNDAFERCECLLSGGMTKIHLQYGDYGGDDSKFANKLVEDFQKLGWRAKVEKQLAWDFIFPMWIDYLILETE